MTKNWMPTIAGLLSAGASFVMFAEYGGFMTIPHWLMGVALFAQAGGLAGLGITAKQYNVTGGSVAQTREAAMRVDTPPPPAAH